MVLGVAGIALAVWVQAQPLINSAQASLIALDALAGPAHLGWRADSATLGNNGTRPPHGNLPGTSALPKCWGASLPVGDGYCLPYPVWRVHLVGPVVNGDCSDWLVFVDARKVRVAVTQGQTGTCGTMIPLS